jgi:uncharacterized protein (TIGR02172 family)
MPSLPDGKPIAFGRTAEIYAWEPGTILKLFYDWFPVAAVQREARLSQQVYQSGLPIPRPGDVLVLNDRLGMIYERVQGPSLFEMLQRKPLHVVRWAVLFARLQKKMHKISIPGMPSLRDRLEEKIHDAAALPVDLKKRTLHLLHLQDNDNRLCHGDFHPANIILTPQGPRIIDWIDAGSGNPLADVSRSKYLLEKSKLDEIMHLTARDQWRRKIFMLLYLMAYFPHHPYKRSSLRIWDIINAAARLEEGITSEEDQLLAIVQEGLQQIKA